MTPVIGFVRDKATIPSLYERGVSVSQLMSDDLEGVAISQTLNRVGMPPVVERGAGEFEYRRRVQVLFENTILAHLKNRGVVGHWAHMLSENLPCPNLRGSYHSVTPDRFTAACVDGLFLQVDVPPGQPLDHLPLDARSGHERLDRPVRHGERRDERLRLHTVKPDQPGGVWFEAADITDRIVGKHIPLGEPLGKDREGRTVSVLRAARAIEIAQELAHSRLGELSGREDFPFGNKAPHLGLVLGAGGPAIDERRKVGGAEGGQELLELAGFEGVVDSPEFRPLLDDELQGNPDTVMAEALDHSIYIVCDFLRRRAAREDAGPAISQGDPGLEPIRSLRSVRHGPESSLPASRFATSYLETGLTPCA